MILVPCVVAATAASVPAAPIFRLASTQVTLRYAAYEFAIERDDHGVPRLNWQVYRARPQAIRTRAVDAIILETPAFRATVIPSMGRLQSFRESIGGREQLWINSAAVALPAKNDTGYWVTWGGVEHVLPRGEHGTSHALRWSGTVAENSASRKAVQSRSIEPLTGLRHKMEFVIYPDRPYLETRITIQNQGRESQRFAHWTTALLAPGGRGEVTARTEFLVGADEFRPADTPLSRWMGALAGPARSSPLRFAQNWTAPGDLAATPLHRGFYAAYSHETGDAVIRLFDAPAARGFTIWMWGYPPKPEHQRQFTASMPNNGYAEFWNGTAADYSDDALQSLAPGETIAWIERMCAVSGLGSAMNRYRHLESACAEPAGLPRR